jgi:hypothetical protein
MSNRGEQASTPLTRSYLVVDYALNAIGDVLGILVLPASHHAPSVRGEHLVHEPIPLPVSLKFWNPVTAIRSRRVAMQYASVPKTSVNEYSNLSACEDHVSANQKRANSDGQILTKPESSPMECRP